MRMMRGGRMYGRVVGKGGGKIGDLKRKIKM